MKQSEVISKLIFLAFVASPEPVPMMDDGKALISWSEAMHAYAEAVSAEREEQWLMTQIDPVPVSESDTDDAAPSPPPQAPPPDLPPLPEPVVLRGSKMQPVGVVTGAKFAGKEAGNKRKIYDRVCAYRAAYGLGAYATIAAASKGKLTEWDVRDIVDGKKVKYDLWLKLKDVLDHLDGVSADAVADNED